MDLHSRFIDQENDLHEEYQGAVRKLRIEWEEKGQPISVEDLNEFAEL